MVELVDQVNGIPSLVTRQKVGTELIWLQILYGFDFDCCCCATAAAKTGAGRVARNTATTVRATELVWNTSLRLQLCGLLMSVFDVWIGLIDGGCGCEENANGSTIIG